MSPDPEKELTIEVRVPYTEDLFGLSRALMSIASEVAKDSKLLQQLVEYRRLVWKIPQEDFEWRTKEQFSLPPGVYRVDRTIEVQP